MAARSAALKLTRRPSRSVYEPGARIGTRTYLAFVALLIASHPTASRLVQVASCLPHWGSRYSLLRRGWRGISGLPSGHRATDLRVQLGVNAAETPSNIGLHAIGSIRHAQQYRFMLVRRRIPLTIKRCFKCLKHGIAGCFLLGDFADTMAGSIRDAGGSVLFAGTEMNELVRELLGVIRAGDLVLLKASRAVGLDRVVDHLKRELLSRENATNQSGESRRRRSTQKREG